MPQLDNRLDDLSLFVQKSFGNTILVSPARNLFLSALAVMIISQWPIADRTLPDEGHVKTDNSETSCSADLKLPRQTASTEIYCTHNRT